MATRKIKDAKDLTTNELIYFKGHAKATYMSDGRSVEDAINEIPEGGGGGGSVGPQGPAGEDGKDGVSITSVVQTTTSTADGGSNVVTVTLSDGKTSTFTVKNGSKGSQGEKGEQGVQGIQGPEGPQGIQGPAGADGANGTNGATFTPSVDANGNLSWTNDKGLPNPATVNIKGPKGDSGSGGGGASSGKKEVVVWDFFNGESVTNMRYDVVYWFVGIDNVIIDSFEEPIAEGYSYDEFTAVVELGVGGASSISLTLPDYVIWANGTIPEVVYGVNQYELSITRISDGYDSIYRAVLTPFKSV